MTTAQKTQMEKANDVLEQELKANVTSEDRQAAVTELDFSLFTVATYLTGKGKNLDTAMKLIEFFRKRISDREKLIA
jgi:hypothetical protein